MLPFTTTELFKFIDLAGEKTYASGAPATDTPERPGFTEFVFAEGDWSYRDSYCGFFRSRGMEVVRFKNTVVWTSAYGGGMAEKSESLANKAFSFLKKALAQQSNFQSVRGPALFKDAEWQYSYHQEGDIQEFNGYEKIHHQGRLVFFHRVIGGLVKNK